MADNWQSPSGGSGNQWTNINLAYDDNEYTTYAYNMDGTGNFSLELTRAALLCDKVRYKFGLMFASTLNAIIHVYYDADYHEIYNGVVETGVWVNKWVVPTNPGEAKTVSKAKLILSWPPSNQGRVYEMNFNQAVVQSVIPNMMKHYKNMRAA